MPRSRILKRAAFLLAAAALAAYVGRNALLGTPVETVEVLRDDLIQTVVASGRVMSPRRVRVGAVITGRVVAIPVTEGQAVKKGAELVLLEDKDVRAALAQAQAGVAQAEAKVRQLREVGLPAAQQALLQAEATLTQVRGQFDRTKRLQAQGFVGQSGDLAVFGAIGCDPTGVNARGLQFGGGQLQVFGLARAEHDLGTRFAQCMGHLQAKAT